MRVEINKSSNVSALEFDPATKILSVWYRSGAAYSYANVDQAIYDRLITAESKGKFLAAEIVKNPYVFPFTKIERRES